MTKTIEVVITADGQTHVETKGFGGASCQEASRFLEVALGSRIQERLTADFYHTYTQQENIQRQQ